MTTESLIAGLIGLLLGGGVGMAIVYRNAKKHSHHPDSAALQQAQVEQARLSTTLTEREREIEELRQALRDLQARFEESTSAHTRAQSEINHLNSKLEEQKQWLAQTQEQFTLQFQNLAQKILEEKSARFSEQNKQQVGQIVEPLRENLKHFREQVEAMRRESEGKHGSLVEQIKQLTQLNQNLSREAQNLTSALKGQNKVAGNWGEMILEKVLERSGLAQDQEFTLQESFKSDTGGTRFTDVVVHLPGERHLIIDSKVSLEAYERACNAEKEELREQAYGAHLLSLKNHIQELSAKSYQNLEGVHSPDFVMLFVPVEPALHMALQRDPMLFDFAFERKVVLVSPTTLLATLKTVANIWRIEKQNRNTEKIASLGGSLHDKFVGFLGDMEEIGNRLRQASDAHQGAMNKLSTGSGNLIRKSQQLIELGAKARKQIDSKYLDPQIEDEPPSAQE